MPRYPFRFAALLATLALSASAQTPEAASAGNSPGPDPRSCSRPVYPPEAAQGRWSGVSTIAFLVGADGIVKHAKIIKSSGYPVLDQAAKEALSRCRFQPAMLDGKPQQAWQPVQYVWSPE